MATLFGKFAALRILHPIDDLDERASKKLYSKEERLLRCQLAAAYRLIDIYGWSKGIYHHQTVRLPGDKDRFLTNPFGLLFHEITASSLITIDAQGSIIDGGSTNFGVNPSGLTLQSAVNQSRPDVRCVLHMHIPEVVAVSCTKAGFVPVCTEGLALGSVSVLDIKGPQNAAEEREGIVSCLGMNNALLLRNHGFVVCGVSVPDAVLKASWFIHNARVQLHLLNSAESLILPDAVTAESTFFNNRKKDCQRKSQTTIDDAEIQWGPGGIDWEANMRLLDSMGLKTGHHYRLNVWREEAK